MSLITLTFGYKGERNNTPHSAISTPSDRINEKIKENAFGSVTIQKTCKFYGQDDVFIVAKVNEGFISNNMKAALNGQEIEIVEVDSKYGGNAKKGMTIGISVKGINEKQLLKGTTLEFEK